MDSTGTRLIAIILAAGTGKRLGMLGQKIPKPLLEFRPQQSILEYNLLTMNKADLFEKIMVVTGYMNSAIREVIKRILLSESLRIEDVVNPFYKSKSVLYSVELGLNSVGEGHILLMNGDTIFSSAMYDSIEKTVQACGVPYCSILGSLRDTYNDDDIMIQLDTNNQVKQIGKHLPSADAIASGMVLLSTSLRPRYEKKLREMKPLRNAIHHDIINSLCQDKNPITFIPTHADEWLEVDTLNDLNLARSIFN
jgi:choline kinase